MSYICSELLKQTCQVANVLKNQCGVKKGDTVIIYMPTMPLAVASMLACARIGAVHRSAKIRADCDASNRRSFEDMLHFDLLNDGLYAVMLHVQCCVCCSQARKS